MDTVLDRFGNKLQVTMYCYPARMWVVCDGEDMPLACVAVSRVNGVGFEWEDEEFSEYKLLDNLRKMKDGKLMDNKFNWYYHEADYFAGVSEGKVLGCVAMKPDGELFCRWRSNLVKASDTAIVWEMRCHSFIHLNEYLPKGLNKVYGLVSVNNVPSNKHHHKVGGEPSMVTVNGRLFNKYELDIQEGALLLLDKAKQCWIDNNIGDWHNPSILLQRELVNVG